MDILSRLPSLLAKFDVWSMRARETIRAVHLVIKSVSMVLSETKVSCVGGRLTTRKGSYRVSIAALFCTFPAAVRSVTTLKHLYVSQTFANTYRSARALQSSKVPSLGGRLDTRKSLVSR